MAVKGLPDKVADLAMERVATLLADRVADRVVEALMKAGLIGNSLMRCLGLSRNKPRRGNEDYKRKTDSK